MNITPDNITTEQIQEAVEKHIDSEMITENDIAIALKKEYDFGFGDCNLIAADYYNYLQLKGM